MTKTTTAVSATWNALPSSHEELLAELDAMLDLPVEYCATLSEQGQGDAPEIQLLGRLRRTPRKQKTHWLWVDGIVARARVSMDEERYERGHCCPGLVEATFLGDQRLRVRRVSPREYELRTLFALACW